MTQDFSLNEESQSIPRKVQRQMQQYNLDGRVGVDVRRSLLGTFDTPRRVGSTPTSLPLLTML